MGHPSIWTSEVDDLVRTAWGNGTTAVDCAALVLKAHGLHVTRNAVIGRAGRQKWVTPNKPVPIADRYMREARAMQRVRLKTGDKRPAGVDGSLAARVKAAPRPPKLPKDKRRTITDTTESRNMTLLELEPDQCRYPTSPDNAVTHLFCGAPQADGSSYCVDHMWICSRRGPGDVLYRSLFKKSVICGMRIAETTEDAA